MKKSNVKIENCKVIFSKEILDYFESLRNDKTSEWIDKYFDALSDTSNFNAPKYNIHHIRPCFTFKDKEHKNRKQTEKLANEFNENRIKLSIKNHIIIHFYLWKIYNNYDSKKAFHQMYNLNKNIDDVNENELMKIAKMIEECCDNNRTEEEIKRYSNEYNKIYYKKNNEKLKSQSREYYHNNIEKCTKKNKKYREENSERIKEQKHNYYLKHIEEDHARSKRYREGNSEKIKQLNHDYYEQNREDILEQKKEYYLEVVVKKNAQLCYDPFEDNFCSLVALKTRKKRHAKSYENIEPMNCILSEEELAKLNLN